MTPEGKVKAKVSAIIKKYVPDVYKFMPVPSGFGASSLDYILCVGSLFVAIETKAPGKKLTPRQEQTCTEIRDAGGVVFVIDGQDPLQYDNLEKYLKWTCSAFRSAQHTAPL